MADEVKDAPKEDWMQKKWRPAMGWMYMVVCFCDMVIFPVAWSILQAVLKQPVTQWNPLTLQGAGLFHLAMGAVLGIAAWGRTQEKVAGASTVPTAVAGSTPVTPPSVTTAPAVPAPRPPAPPVARPAPVPVAAKPVDDDEPPFNPRHRDE
jgi:hypothetical protein